MQRYYLLPAGLTLRVQPQKAKSLSCLNKSKAWSQTSHDSILMDGMELKKTFPYILFVSSQYN